MDFNYIDIAIAVIIVITALIGFMRGLVWMAIFLTTWSAAILFAIKYSESLAAVLPIQLGKDIMQIGLAALLIFLGVLMVGTFINYLMNRAITAIGLGAFDRILGAGLGVLLGVLAITLVIMLAGITEQPSEEYWQTSKFIPRFQEASEWIRTLVPQNFNTYLDENIGISNTSKATGSAIITPSQN